MKIKIAIYGRKVNDSKIEYIQELISKLEDYNIELSIFKEFYDIISSQIVIKSDIKFFTSYYDIDKTIHFLISIGGDGTFLSTLELVRDSNIPILGINIGRLGFLSSVTKEEICFAIQSLLNNNFSIEQRSLISVVNPIGIMGEVNFAMNEVYILKTDEDNMIKIKLLANNLYVNTYWADGLIISTPTGSTGYSLSCGGPIVSPLCESFIITPISTHNLTVRPIIIPDTVTILAEVEARSSNVILGMDSRKQKIKPNKNLKIKKSFFKINLVKIGEQNFYSTIRSKLMWGLDLRN